MSTTAKNSTVDFDKCQEPSVMSTDAKERKLARRIRIQRRLEAMKKQEGDNDEEEAEKTRTEKQIEASAELMEKLVTEGDEVVSNVRVANDAREIQRREEEIAIRKSLLNNLEAEAEDSMKKYVEINSKWSGILASKDPLDIHAAIKSQNEKCRQVAAQKDVIIGQLKEQLERADNKFAEDEKKQNEDINLLIERIDNQMNTLAKAYRRELTLIEDTLKNERSVLLQNITKKWDLLYQQRQDDELDSVVRRRKIIREYEDEMNRVIIDHQEQHRANKISLETECQKLQQQVQDMKAMCLLNIEKLDYNYTVLKRREDENTIVKNQQKRRINKLQDVVNGLKKTWTELQENTRLKIEKMQEQVNKSYKSIGELESKSSHFTYVNDQQYLQIWEMNTNTANKLIDEILTVDKIIYEQVLGLEWEPLAGKLLKKEDLPSYREAMEIIEQKKNHQLKITGFYSPKSRDSSPERRKLERKLLNHILHHIADQTGFLIEEKMQQLLSCYTEKDQVIIQLDNVFQALNINSEKQINLLINFFLPYSHCPTCTEIIQSEASPKVDTVIEKSSNDENCPCDIRLDERAVRLVKEVMLHLPPDPDLDDDKKDEQSTDAPKTSLDSQIISSIDSLKKQEEQHHLLCDKGHLLKINSDNVIKALREFVEKFEEVNSNEKSENYREKKYGNDNNKVTLSRSITAKDMTDYWKSYRELFSPEREQLWDALNIGLHKYHEILKEREKLINDTDSLRKQNLELKRLLETCKVKTDVNLIQRATKSAHT